jgi:hypothetical protein
VARPVNVLITRYITSASVKLVIRLKCFTILLCFEEIVFHVDELSIFICRNINSREMISNIFDTI